MHTHVAWVKIKPYSSLAAVSLSPASVHHKIWQPFSAEEKPRRGAADFTAFPNQARLETGARRRDARQPRISPPSRDGKLRNGRGFFFFSLLLLGIVVEREAKVREETLCHSHLRKLSHDIRAPLSKSRRLVNMSYFFLGRWIQQTIAAAPPLICRLWLSPGVEGGRGGGGWGVGGYTGCRWGRGWLAPTRGERLTPQELLRGLSVLSR